MTRRFSSEELHGLRNRVPIEQVLETLRVRYEKDSNDKLSFSCPICGGWDTAIHAAHNLARCFSCRKNFNPIELVMHQLKTGFVDSVKWLQDRMPIDPPNQNTSFSRSNPARPMAVGDILSDLIPVVSERKTHAKSLEAIAARISQIEERLNQLDRIVNTLQSSRDQ